MYTIKEASARSGVGAPLIRAWERRYGVVTPTRTPAGYRLYDDDAIAVLLAMRAWSTRAGRPRRPRARSSRARSIRPRSRRRPASGPPRAGALGAAHRERMIERFVAAAEASSRGRDRGRPRRDPRVGLVRGGRRRRPAAGRGRARGRVGRRPAQRRRRARRERGGRPTARRGVPGGRRAGPGVGGASGCRPGRATSSARWPSLPRSAGAASASCTWAPTCRSTGGWTRGPDAGAGGGHRRRHGRRPGGAAPSSPRCRARRPDGRGRRRGRPVGRDGVESGAVRVPDRVVEAAAAVAEAVGRRRG